MQFLYTNSVIYILMLIYVLIHKFHLIHWVEYTPLCYVRDNHVVGLFCKSAKHFLNKNAGKFIKPVFL